MADYNFLFNDVHWMKEDMASKQIGGKLGIIEDPFGKAGSPVYLGATTPIDRVTGKEGQLPSCFAKKSCWKRLGLATDGLS